MALILASTSSIRAQMLDQAGVAYRIEAPRLDEQPIKQRHDGDAASLARRLAEAKAKSIVAAPKDIVVGSDCVISVDGTRFSKPRDRAEAAEHLAAFSGRTMLLSSAVALVSDGKVEWSYADTARLEVRSLSASFIDSYLDAEWPAVSYCVGVFRMEGRGVTLFNVVEGSHFTILGMPLLPLLGALRQRGIVPS
ncbi:MAG: Maf family protein [Sphingomonas bacterium]|nr:Maf family protein [Sphingomonas bacterium]